MVAEFNNPDEHAPSQQNCGQDWERVTAELRACRESQRQLWGNLDNATLGRYLAGESAPEECREVEAALLAHPDLQILTDLVRDIIEEVEPVLPDAAPAPSISIPTPAIVVPVSAPGVLPFPSRNRPGKKAGLWQTRIRGRGALAAAACVLVALGLTLSGFSYRQERAPQLASLDPGVARTGVFPAGLANAEIDRSTDQVWSQLEPEVAKLDAQTSLQRGISLVKEGDVARAEPYFARANSLCKEQLGPTHQATRESVRNLANVYQVALDEPVANRKREQLADVAAPAPTTEPKHPVVQDAGKMTARTQSARVLRDRIVSAPPQEVRRVVVPVLVQALQQTANIDERIALIRALGELGPAARDAVPLLTASVKQGETTDERQAALQALGQMGPAAGTAVPTLLSCLDGPCLESRRNAGKALVQLGPVARNVVCKQLNDKSTIANTVTNEVLRQLQGQDGRIGINDSADIFNLRTFHEASRLIHHLARIEQIEIVVETLPAGIPSARVQETLAQMGPRSLVVQVVKNPLTTQFTASPCFPIQGTALKALEKTLAVRISDRQADAGLLALLRSLMTGEGKKAKQ